MSKRDPFGRTLRAYCKGCEGLDDLLDDGFCGFCREDVVNGHRDEDSGDLNEKGERYYKEEEA